MWLPLASSAGTVISPIRNAALVQRRSQAPDRKLITRCTNNASRERMLQHLRELPASALKQYVDQHAEDINLSFFAWLASREDALEGDKKLEHAILAGQLMAIKEGLEPLHFDEVAEDLQHHWEAARAADASARDSSAALPPTDRQTADSSRADQQDLALVSQPQAMIPGSDFAQLQPFSDAGLARQSEQVRVLNLDVKQARATSTVQLIGRRKINADEPQQGPQAVSDAARRILEYLLQLPDAGMRREVLPDAFQAAPELSEQGYDASSDGHDAENEQLSTTPLQLLQAIDLERSRLSRGTSGLMQGQSLLPGGQPTSPADVQDALHQLRQDVLDVWKAD